MAFSRSREINRGGVIANADRVDRPRRRGAQSDERKHGRYTRADTTQASPSKAHPVNLPRSAGAMQSASEENASQLYVVFTTRTGRKARAEHSSAHRPFWIIMLM